MKITTKLTLVSVCAMVLSGCAQPPRQVEAQVPLVGQSTITYSERIPEKYWVALNNPITTQINASGMMVAVGKPYTSGLGQECRALQMMTDINENRTRIACAKLESSDISSASTTPIKVWYLTDNIVETSTIIKIQ
ncbi:hypothetical protein [Vibrio sp. CB1-14]|uniref:Lipoprotein n=1 Tax=Vibrio chaetopteri TaxID=3016528 RepID=A0AAU8BKS0_9VIBR